MSNTTPIKYLTMLSALWLALISAGSSALDQRTALVVGNSDYKQSPLINPENDAKDIAKALQEAGFNVILKLDADQIAMEDAIREFGSLLAKRGGVGLFYYAGHGIQHEGRNYLIPIGAPLRRAKDLRYKAVDVGQVLDEMGHAQNGFNIVILDACRDNPLPRSFRSSARGLARMDSPRGTLLAYATSPGAVAMDGEGSNGIYTKYLLQHMQTPGISIEKVFKLVLQDVDRASHGRQTPWLSSSFTGDFYFYPAQKNAVVEAGAHTIAQPADNTNHADTVAPAADNPESARQQPASQQQNKKQKKRPNMIMGF